MSLNLATDRQSLPLSGEDRRESEAVAKLPLHSDPSKPRFIISYRSPIARATFSEILSKNISRTSFVLGLLSFPMLFLFGAGRWRQCWRSNSALMRVASAFGLD
jgi:hypothetical protein